MTLHLPAEKVGKVRIVRRSGKTRQPFEVENANRRRRGEHVPLVTSHLDDNSEAALPPLDGRLKVVPERSAPLVVPFELSEGKFSHEDMSNPVNQLGAVLEEQVPLVTSNDFDSFYAAFLKRCNFKQAPTDDDIEDDVFKEALSLIDSIPPALFTEWEEDEETVERWLDKFDAAKQSRMRRCEENIPWCSSRYLGTKDLSVKMEVLLKRLDPTWAPRVIYAGNDEFNRVTGPAMMVVMERLMTVLADHRIGGCDVKLAYKTSDVPLASFLDSSDHTRAYEGDFSANDREQRSRVAIVFDRWLEKLCMPRWLRNLMIDMSRFKVQNRRFGMTGVIEHQLPTGTTATTPRNSCYNITMAVVSLIRQIAAKDGTTFGETLSIEPPISRAKMVVLGDDILFVTWFLFCVSEWKKVVDKFRMKLKGKNPELNGHATLLSRRLIITGDITCMIPLIGKALARFNARATDNEDVTASQYAAGKALSYAYEFRHVPFCRDYFLQRFDMEDNDDVVLQELTWFTKSNHHSVKDVVAAIKNERVLVNDWIFAEWLMNTYDLGLCELEELFELVVINREMEVVTHYAVDRLAIDW